MYRISAEYYKNFSEQSTNKYQETKLSTIMKGLMNDIVLLTLISIDSASQSGLICYVKNAISEQANTIDLAPDAIVGDLAQSIIDLGVLNGLALPFVTADELTMDFGGMALQPMTKN